MGFGTPGRLPGRRDGLSGRPEGEQKPARMGGGEGGQTFQAEGLGDQGLLCRCVQVSPCQGRGTAWSRCRPWGGCCTWDRPRRPRRGRTPVSAATWRGPGARSSCWRCTVSRAAPGGRRRKGGPPGTLGGRTPPSRIRAKTETVPMGTVSRSLLTTGALRAAPPDQCKRGAPGPRGARDTKCIWRRLDTKKYNVSVKFLLLREPVPTDCPPQRGDEIRSLGKTF